MTAAHKQLQDAIIYSDVDAKSDEKKAGRKARAKKPLDDNYVYNSSLTELPPKKRARATKNNDKGASRTEIVEEEFDDEDVHLEPPAAFVQQSKYEKLFIRIIS